jgi:predicted nucleic acid-binding protein
VLEIEECGQKGRNVLDLKSYEWLEIVEPQAMPSEWLAFDLGPGELAAMALALENRKHVVLSDDDLARRVAKAAGVAVWGTLRCCWRPKSEG